MHRIFGTLPVKSKYIGLIACGFSESIELVGRHVLAVDLPTNVRSGDFNAKDVTVWFIDRLSIN